MLRFSVAAPQETSAAATSRLPGLDWLRAGAALAVVALHAGIPYMAHPLPALEWCVRCTERSSLVDALCWAINGAVMPTFCLMGGCLAAGTWKREPGGAFLVHRSRRLLLPLLLAMLVVLPADMYVWLIGWYTEGLISWRKVLSIKLPSPLSEQFWGVAHLWYLQCLWTLSVGAFAAMAIQAWWRRLRDQSPATASLQSHRRSPWAFVSLPVAGGLILACDPTFLIGFQQRWWPGPAAIAFYGLFFATGWNWRDTAGAQRMTRMDGHRGLTPPARRLVVAVAIFPPVLFGVHWHGETPLAGLSLHILTTLFSAYGWLVATGLFGLARALQAPAIPKQVAFVAEASFWMYLVHHPLVGLTQLAMLHSNWPPAVKFLFSLMTSVMLSLASYAVLVRGTWVGQLLDGRRLVRPVAPAVTPAIEEPVRRAA